MVKEKIKEKKTALVLSGGGARGGYQIGVWKALRELGITPQIVTGTSVGAINAAMVVQNAFDAALDMWQRLETEMVFDIDTADYKRLINYQLGRLPLDEVAAYLREAVIGGGAGSDGLYEILRSYVNEEDIRRSPIDMGLVTVCFPSFKPNLLYKEDIPKGKLRNYILASASAFPAVKRYKIDDKLYIDGSYYDVMPIGMAMNKGATDIIAVNLKGAGIIHYNDIHKAKEKTGSLKIIESPWNLGNILTFDPKNTQRILRLGYLETMKAYGQYDGESYTFEKNAFTKTEVREADALANIFHLNADQLYSRKNFNQEIRPAILNSQIAFRKMERGLTRKTHLSHLSKEKAGDRILTVLIAENLVEKKEKSIFLKKAALSTFQNQIFAAGYILRNGWTISGNHRS